MSKPVPELPTNVQSNNPYNGLDRGLFLIQYPDAPKPARIHAARYVSRGPNAAVGVLEYQVMQYNQMPTTAAQYAAWELLTAPDGTQWFDRLVRGSVLEPIVVEYWATDSFLKWYHGENGAKLEGYEIENVFDQAKVFVKTMGSWCGLEDVELTATFNAVAGAPLVRISASLGIDYKKDGQLIHIDEDTLPAGEFDPVRVALSILKVK